MVLGRERLRAGRALAPLALVGAIAGCLHPPAPARVRRGEHRAVLAMVVETAGGRSVSAPPDAVWAAMEAELDARGLGVARAEAPLLGSFDRVRFTEERLAALDGSSTGGDVLLLVELLPRFYSQLAGRFRWTVQARVSVARRGAPERAVTLDHALAVFVDYAHEREAEALATAAEPLRRAVAPALDGFIAALDGDTVVEADPAPVGGSPRSLPGAATPDAGANPAPGAFAAPPLGSVYFVLVDRFANGEPANDAGADPLDPVAFHGGDLRGVLAHVDYLERLGVRTVWLSPIFLGATAPVNGVGAYHGYWVHDLARVDPRFGDGEDLAALGEALEARGMQLVLDLVLNHVGYDAPLVAARPEWFHAEGEIEDWDDPREVTRGRVFGLPDLAQERRDVFGYLVDVSRRWLDGPGVAGFRLDAARHVPAVFWRRFAARMRAHAGREVVLLAEMLVGDARALADAEARGAFSHLLDYPLHFALREVLCGTGDPGKLAAALAEDRRYRAPERLVTFLDNHDTPRIASLCKEDRVRLEDAFTFQLALRGVPAITYGSEVGLAGFGEPAHRGDMRFAEGDALAAHVRRLLDRRRESPALRGGASAVVALERGRFAFARLDADEAVVVAVNRTAAPWAVPLPAWLSGAVRARDLSRGGEVPAGALEVAPGRVGAFQLVPGEPGGFRRAGERAARAMRGETPLWGVRFDDAPVSGLEPGEWVGVVGSIPELGDWDVGRAVTLKRSPSGALEARVGVPEGVAFAYRYVRGGSGRPPRLLGDGDAYALAGDRP